MTVYPVGPKSGITVASVLVLVVEDEFLLRLHAVSLLEAAGFSTLEAGNADEAIAWLEARGDVRVVFTDINMPGAMDGLRLAHVIGHRWPPVGLVVTSGQMRVGEAEMPERGQFLNKPYSAMELVGTVRSLVH